MLKLLATIACATAATCLFSSAITLSVMGLPRRRYYPIVNDLLDHVFAVTDGLPMLHCQTSRYSGYVSSVRVPTELVFTHHASIRTNGVELVAVTIPFWHPLARKFNKLMKLHREGRDSEFLITSPLITDY